MCKLKKAYRSSNQGPPGLTPCALTTQPLPPLLLTALYFCFINGFLSLFRPIVDIIKIIDLYQWNSKRFYECSIGSQSFASNRLINREIHSYIIVIFFPWNITEELNYKKKWNLLKGSHSSCKKGCGPVWQSYTRWPGWESCEIKVVAKKWLWWSMAKNFNNNNSHEAGMRTQIDLNCCY